MKGRMAYLAALTALMACSDPQSFESKPAELTPAGARTHFALQADHGASVVLVVDEATNPRQVPIVLVAEDNGHGAVPRQLTLYPPDRPARFALRLSPDATRLTITLRTERHDETQSSPRVRVRLERSAAGAVE